MASMSPPACCFEARARPWWFFEGFGALAGTRLAAVDPEGANAPAIPSRPIVGGVVHASCALESPGHVRHHFGNGLILGEPSGHATTRAQALVDTLKAAGFDATLSAQIQKDVWYKLWGNMTVNPVSAVTGAITDRILDDPLGRGWRARARKSAPWPAAPRWRL